MDHSVEGWVGYNGLVKGVRLSNVLDDDEVQLGFGDVGMVLEDVLALLLRPNGGDDRVSVLE